MDEGELYYSGTVTELLEMTKGKVYTAQISRKDLSRMKENYTLTSMLTQGNNVTVRFLAEQLRRSGLRPASTSGGRLSVSDAWEAGWTIMLFKLFHERMFPNGKKPDLLADGDHHGTVFRLPDGTDGYGEGAGKGLEIMASSRARIRISL